MSTISMCKVLAAVLFFLAPSLCIADTITFDNLSDSTYVTTQYSNVTFSNAIVLSAGISLNETDFPPLSGNNVASDINGAMVLSFVQPVYSFSGYFTYAVPLTVQGYSVGNMLVASASSLFSANYVSGGDLGSSPNELLSIMSATPFTRVVLTGDRSGGSFTLDNASFSTTNVSSPSPVPEPVSLVLVLTGAAAIVQRRSSQRRS